jgi:hypothetical protein
MSTAPRNNQPISLRQKQTLVAVYQQTGNMSQAMREASIRSRRTAYLWWRRFCELGELGLKSRSRARHTQARLSKDLVEQICQIRRDNRTWGRRKIASHLAHLHGRRVASPASIEAVLRRARLWHRQSEPIAPSPQRLRKPQWLDAQDRPDYEHLLETIQAGISLSIQSESLAATKLLFRQIWQPLQTDRLLWSKLLTTSDYGLGSWLLGSWLHLGHSLMNSGDWLRAEQFLRETIDWMNENAPSARQRDWEEGPHLISLRRNDVWLGCYMHLGLVLGKSDLTGALGYLTTAIDASSRGHQPRAPHDRAMIGDLERNLAYIKLRLRRLSKREVQEVNKHLANAQRIDEEAGSPGIKAFTSIAWARLYDRQAREAGTRDRATYRKYRDLMEQALQQATDLVEMDQVDRPMRQTICFIDVAELAHVHGLPLDGRRLERAAQHCLTYGYRNQARSLLAIPGVHAWLSEDALLKLPNASQPRGENEV